VCRDAETFADATTRYRLRVINLAFPGYGPQQFLRALETYMFRDLLTEPRLFVFLTAPWRAERSACMSTFVLRAPRYVMVDGRPAYKTNASTIGWCGCDICSRGPRYIASSSSRCSAAQDRPIWISMSPS
jgi:hypothetical protein